MLTMRVSFHPLNFIKLRKQRWFKGKKEKGKKKVSTRPILFWIILRREEERREGKGKRYCNKHCISPENIVFIRSIFNKTLRARTSALRNFFP